MTLWILHCMLKFPRLITVAPPLTKDLPFSCMVSTRPKTVSLHPILVVLPSQKPTKPHDAVTFPALLMSHKLLVSTASWPPGLHNPNSHRPAMPGRPDKNTRVDGATRWTDPRYRWARHRGSRTTPRQRARSTEPPTAAYPDPTAYPDREAAAPPVLAGGVIRFMYFEVDLWK